MITYLDFPVYSSGCAQRVAVRSILSKTKSAFQDILIIDSPEFGKCLILDGIMQSAELDHSVYDAALLKELSPRDERLLIVGGGDGWVAETALLNSPDLQITVVEIDIAVVTAACDHLKTKAFQGNQVCLVVGDALEFLETWANSGEKTFDGIAIDLTDNPRGEGCQRSFEEFHKRTIQACSRVLNPGGWLSVQAGASHVMPSYRDAARFLEAELRREFERVWRTDVAIPSYGEEIAFLYARVHSSADGNHVPQGGAQ